MAPLTELPGALPGAPADPACASAAPAPVDPTGASAAPAPVDAAGASAPCALPDDAELEALLHLRLLPGLSDRKLRALLAEYGSARSLLRAGGQVLGDAARAARRAPRVLERLRRSLLALEQLQVTTLVVDRALYPEPLLALHDPPPLLFARGRLELLQGRILAIVGSRRHTQYGAGAAERLARELGELGFVIISGLARGIDGIAHRAALETGSIAVLGCGIDVAYPRENERLFDRLCASGLVVSEFPPGEPPLRHHFPQRNRIIAALAEAVIVVEATGDSGSLITADHALDLGLDVFVVPGPIGRETSAGSNALIQEGGELVTCAADVVDSLSGNGRGSRAHRRGDTRRRVERLMTDRRVPVSSERVAPAELSAPAAALFRALDAAPRHVDELAATCALPASIALAELLTLELLGHARQLAGTRFVRG